jgi:DNA-directed RNA polymerase beta' subunit
MISLDFEIYKKVDELAEITDQKIHVSNKQEKFHSEGLYSEQIFGPVQKLKCQCGKVFGKLNSGKVCDSCNVLCGDTEGRSSIFAKIVFPEGIFIVNPIFKNIVQQIFGQNAVKSLLSKRDYQSNKELPYFYSLEKHKLLKESKMKATEKRIEVGVSDIVDLKELFFKVYSMPEYKEHIESFVIDPKFLEFIFIDYVLVIPPNSRQIIKISPTKILPHPITKCYSQIMKNRLKNSGVSDQLFKANPEYFGYTVYKYQSLVDEIYETILEFNFQKKESYIREALTGKTVEFSQRAVIIPNPALRPYQIGMHTEAVKKIFLPELLYYLYTKYENEAINDDNFTIIDFVQYIYKSFTNDFQINIRPEDFVEFLKEHMKDFKVICERQPVLWKYNTSGYKLANVYDDKDVIPLRDNKDYTLTKEEEDLLKISNFFGKEYCLDDTYEIEG